MKGASAPAGISLGLTKSDKRQGAAESVTITERTILQVLWLWKRSVEPFQFLTSKPLEWLFTKCGSLDRVLVVGRWTAVKTAKNCPNSGLAMLADLQIPHKLLAPFRTISKKTAFCCAIG